MLLYIRLQTIIFVSIQQPGVTTDEIDEAVHIMIIEKGAYPSALGYGGFPKSVCTSVNECMCHGIPDSRPLEVCVFVFSYVSMKTCFFQFFNLYIWKLMLVNRVIMVILQHDLTLLHTGNNVAGRMVLN